MHKADLVNSVSYCSTLEHPRSLSDHSPVAFGFKKRAKTPGFYLPAWVATHINFEVEVAEAFEHLKQRFAEESYDAEPTPAEELTVLKMAIRKAAKNIRAADALKLASTTKHKLAVTLSFIMSIH